MPSLPLDPAAGKAILDAGGWTVVVLLVIGAGVGLWRRWWVLGWMWVQERRDRLTSDGQAKANARATARLAREVSRLATALESIDEQLGVILGRLDQLERERGDRNRGA